jgi:hypothetical protein
MKRQKEIARMEKQRDKQAKRLEKKRSADLNPDGSAPSDEELVSQPDAAEDTDQLP